MTPDARSLVRGGFRGEGASRGPRTRGGLRNGVRTAVEDFLAEHPEYGFTVDAVSASARSSARGDGVERAVRETFAPYDNERLVRRPSANRPSSTSRSSSLCGTRSTRPRPAPRPRLRRRGARERRPHPAARIGPRCVRVRADELARASTSFAPGSASSPLDCFDTRLCARPRRPSTSLRPQQSGRLQAPELQREAPRHVRGMPRGS